MFSALSLNHGHLNDKINSFIALAPVASFKMQISSDTKEKLAGLQSLIDDAT